MIKTKIEIYLKENQLSCEILIVDSIPRVSIYKENSLYVRFFTGVTLNEAIEAAVNNHRELKNAHNRKLEIQDEKRARNLHQRILKR